MVTVESCERMPKIEVRLAKIFGHLPRRFEPTIFTNLPSRALQERKAAFNAIQAALPHAVSLELPNEVWHVDRQRTC